VGQQEYFSEKYTRGIFAHMKTSVTKQKSANINFTTKTSLGTRYRKDYHEGESSSRQILEELLLKFDTENLFGWIFGFKTKEN